MSIGIAKYLVELNFYPDAYPPLILRLGYLLIYDNLCGSY